MVFLRGIECLLSRAPVPAEPFRDYLYTGITTQPADLGTETVAKKPGGHPSEEAHPDTEIDPYSCPLTGSRLAHGEKKVVSRLSLGPYTRVWRVVVHA